MQTGTPKTKASACFTLMMTWHLIVIEVPTRVNGKRMYLALMHDFVSWDEACHLRQVMTVIAFPKRQISGAVVRRVSFWNNDKTDDKVPLGGTRLSPYHNNYTAM